MHGADAGSDDLERLARRHLARIASEPRPAGGEAECRARDYCESVLREVGFDVRAVPFEYSSAVGRWAMPAGGALWLVVLASAAMAGSRGWPGAALAMLVVGLSAIVVGARRAVADGVMGLPFARRPGVNLVATRGSVLPRVWLVAHLDSKSQPVPMVARVAGIGSSAMLAAVALATALAQLAGVDATRAWPVIGLVGAVCAGPVIGSVIGGRSAGALDDGSGVATVLLAATADGLADALPTEIGVLLTSAEELGLAGAHAWARTPSEGGAVVASAAGRGTRAVVLNVDVVDDRGAMRVMSASTLPAGVEAVVDGESVRRGRLPPGVLVDAIALASVGFAALTISKATLQTLARVHTPRDRIDRLHGGGIVAAAALVRRLAAAAEADRSG